VASKAKPCPDCNDTGVLAGYGFGVSINACDRPCPCGAKPEIDEGPSEWTVIERRCVYRSDEVSPHEQWCVDVRKGEHTRYFEVYANRLATTVKDLADHRGHGYVLFIRGEYCVDMAIARLLCGLRDGTVRP
jgi:hypothetical protein